MKPPTNKKLIRGAKPNTIPKTTRSRWDSRRGKRVRLHPLAKLFGDGREVVLLSFYSAPELAIAVRWDSTLPLDLPDNERFKPYEGVKSFRDVLDQVYDALEEQFERPPISNYSRGILIEEIDEAERIENEQTKDEALWALIINNGSTWCYL